MIGICLSIIFGVIIGLFFQSPFLSSSSDTFIDLGLCLLLFFVGIDIGDNSAVLSNLKKYGKKI